MRQLIDRLIEPRLDRGQELIASSLGALLGVAIAVLLACLALACPQLIHGLFS